MKKGKIQTNDYKVNVLVEHEDGSNKHFSSLDVNVLCEKMTEEEIDKEFRKITLTLKDKKNFLSKVKGFAISNCIGKNKEFDNSDLFRYRKDKR